MTSPLLRAREPSPAHHDMPTLCRGASRRVARILNDRTLPTTSPGLHRAVARPAWATGCRAPRVGGARRDSEGTGLSAKPGPFTPASTSQDEAMAEAAPGSPSPEARLPFAPPARGRRDAPGGLPWATPCRRADWLLPRGAGVARAIRSRADPSTPPEGGRGAWLPGASRSAHLRHSCWGVILA